MSLTPSRVFLLMVIAFALGVWRAEAVVARFRAFQERIGDGWQGSVEAVIMAPVERTLLEQKVVLEVRRMEEEDVSRERMVIGAKLRLYPEVSLGDRVVLSCRFRRSDDDAFFAFSGSTVASMCGSARLLETHPAEKTTLRMRLAAVPDLVAARIEKILPEPEAGLLMGIVLGARGRLDATLQNAMRATGTSHITALSGYNVTILIGIFLPLLPWFGISRRWYAWCCAPLLVAFAVMTGEPASLLRASVFAISLLLSASLGRGMHLLSALTNAVAAILIWRPLLLYDVGFQLSVAATWGLAAVLPRIEAMFEKFLAEKKENADDLLSVVARSDLVASFASTLATAPVSLMHFGRVSLRGIFLNTLILPLSPAIMLMGSICITLSFLSPVLAYTIAPVVWILCALMRWGIELGAALSETQFWILTIIVTCVYILARKIKDKKYAVA